MEEPRIISAVLHGPPGTSKETLLLMTVRMAQERLKNPKIFCLSGAEFQALYVSCFLPENRIDGDRLNIFKKCLFEADLLAISDIDGTTSKAVGTKKLLAEAIKAVLNRGGRVLVSLSVELSVESLGEDLFRVISGFTRFRTEKVGIEHYKKIAWQYLRRNPPQIKTSLPRGNKGQIPSLDPKVVSWVVSRAQIAGNLSFLLSCLDRISFSQGIEGGEKKVTLPKAQEILGLRPTIPDINAFVLEKYRQGDTCEAETLPEEALGIVAYFAIEISGINRSEVARSIYPGPCRGEEKTEARVNEIEQKLKEPGEARDLFCDLVKDFLRRFSVPESKNLFWSHRLQEWV